jgi:hypothetical protein
MITYKEACDITNSIRKQNFPGCKHTAVVELADRWVFTLTECGEVMIQPPAFSVFKEDGRVEWFSIPPLENLDLLESGKKIPFIG